MKTVFSLVLLSALTRVTFSHLYYFVPVKMSWSEAQMYCRQHYTDIATIDDQNDVDELLKTIGTGYSNQQTWIGLSRPNSTAPWIWSDQSNSMFSSWASKQPNNYQDQQYCVATYLDGLWNDEYCGAKCPSVCYSERMRELVRFEVRSSQKVNDPGMKTDVLGKISPKIMTTCHAVGPPPAGNRMQIRKAMDSTRHMKVSCGIWHQDISCRSFTSCSCHVSNWHPHEWPDPGFPSRTLSRASRSLQWLNRLPTVHPSSITSPDRADTKGQGVGTRRKTVMEKTIRWECLPKEPEE